MSTPLLKVINSWITPITKINRNQIVNNNNENEIQKSVNADDSDDDYTTVLLLNERPHIHHHLAHCLYLNIIQIISNIARGILGVQIPFSITILHTY